MRSPRTTTSSPYSLQLEKALAQQWRPAQPKINKKLKKKKVESKAKSNMNCFIQGSTSRKQAIVKRGKEVGKVHLKVHYPAGNHQMWSIAPSHETIPSGDLQQESCKNASQIVIQGEERGSVYPRVPICSMRSFTPTHFGLGTYHTWVSAGKPQDWW